MREVLRAKLHLVFQHFLDSLDREDAKIDRGVRTHRAHLVGEYGDVERVFAGDGVSFRVRAGFDGERESGEDVFELVLVVLVFAEFSPAKTGDGFELRRAEAIPGVSRCQSDF